MKDGSDIATTKEHTKVEDILRESEPGALIPGRFRENNSLRWDSISQFSTVFAVLQDGEVRPSFILDAQANQVLNFN